MTSISEIEALVRAKLPADTVVRLGYAQGDWLSLPEPERRLMANAVAARRSQFAAGRMLARAALMTLGQPMTSLTQRSDGGPNWPASVVGSLSHSQDLAIAVVARKKTCCGLGIDLEAVGHLPKNVAHHVLTAGERRCQPDQKLQLRTFSAKEAIYKCLAPLGASTLEFADVELDWRDDQFSARAVTERGRSAPLLSTLQGVAFSAGTHLISLCYLPTTADQSPS